MRTLSLLRSFLLGLIGAFFLLELTVLAILSSSRGFQVDEVEHIHAAYNVRSGKLIYRDFRQDHNPLLYFVLWPVIDPDQPEGSFRHARTVTTALLLVNVALCGICAYRLRGLTAGVVASGLALCHTTFVERGMEVRTDGPMALAVVAALAVELSGMERLKRYCLEALLLSVAFLFTNKACFACFAFGCLWLAAAFTERRPALVAAPMGVWLFPLLAVLGWMAVAGNLRQFVDINFVFAGRELLRTGAISGGFEVSPGWKYVSREGLRNTAFCAAALGGWAIAVASWRRGPAPERGRSGLRFTAVLAAVLFLSLWLNPFPYPYLQVTVLPVFAVLAGVAGASVVGRLGLEPWGAAAWFTVLLLLAAAGLQGLPYLALRSISFLEPQLETLRAIHRATEPDEAVFDMVGLHFRPDGHYFYNLTRDGLKLYRLGEAGGIRRIPDELRDREVAAFIMNYRFEGLPQEDRRFLLEHFAQYDGNVFLAGSSLPIEAGESLEFEVLKSKPFRYDGDGAILVDGEPFRQGLLGKGVHRITRVERRGPDRLIAATSPPVPWPPRPVVQLFDFF